MQTRDQAFLGTEPVGRLLMRLAIPTVIAQLVNMLYNIVDRIYIGHIAGIGSLALTGVGVCMPISMIVTAFAALVASGSAPRASIAMGRGDHDTAEKLLGGSFSLQIAISLTLTAVLLIWAAFQVWANMFGTLGAVKLRTAHIMFLLPLAFTASLASITEPMDFLFCFSAPVLWLAHAAISGAFIVLLHLCHVTAFTSNLLGSLAMNLSAGVARTHYPVLYLLGLAQIAVYFVVFTALIKALDLPTPGRRPEEPVRPEAAPLDDAGVEKLIAALGGRENICTVDNCFTRLRVTVQDAAFVREQALRELPCSGVVQNGCNVQIVFGIRAPQVRQAVEQRLDRVVC